ncbi:universal stress protein [Gorillibacterium timonense]|uniref:universal stress protein n=1 Tax=Gorillibacterium timonense TaxID=1689269 RepID=UPI00071CE8A5|nr:universal stress protein [Gorillibacterium timonense]
MIFRTILVPFDGSKASRKALDKAIQIASSDPAIRLDVINVLQFPTLVVGEAMIAAPASMQKEYYDASEELLQEAKALLDPLPNPTKTILEDGQPAETILSYAEQNGVDLIVIGSRGLGNIRSFVLGSVSHNVVQHAKVPVLVVK